MARSLGSSLPPPRCPIVAIAAWAEDEHAPGEWTEEEREDAAEQAEEHPAEQAEACGASLALQTTPESPSKGPLMTFRASAASTARTAQGAQTSDPSYILGVQLAMARAALASLQAETDQDRRLANQAAEGEAAEVKVAVARAMNIALRPRSFATGTG